MTLATRRGSLIGGPVRVTARILPPKPASSAPACDPLAQVVLQRRAALCDAMETYGGNWVRLMAAALRAADPANAIRIAKAFPELIATYGPDSPFQSRP